MVKDKRLMAGTLGVFAHNRGCPQACGDHSEHLLNLLLDKELQSRRLPFIRHIADMYRVGKVAG